ncbi:MAG: hypothetical protein PVG32_13170 [Anaerolineales bacterium]|jgi:hypothetical protein
MESNLSLFDRVISRPRPAWVIVVVAFVLLLTPFAAAYADGLLNELLDTNHWRGLLIPPSVILYIWIVAPIMGKMESNVISSIRPIVKVDSEEFERLVNQARTMNPRNEIVAIGAGLLFGLLYTFGNSDTSLSWTTIYWFLFSPAMYALLAWTIYVALAGTRLTTALLGHPLRVDPFDVTPFEPIGRQSLFAALVFVGGITLSLVFVAFESESLIQPAFWLIYAPLLSVPILIFFLNMIPTHRVIAAAKASELEAVRRHILRSCRELLERLERNQDSGKLPAEINALGVYERRLKSTRTWPYNTAMLRTLFFSVLFPIGTVLLRVIGEALVD